MLPGWLVRARWVALAAAAALLVAHAYVYDFVTDDAYISFVFSRNFAEHGQLAFNAGGHPVEGYTNFLWTLILGLLMMLGARPEVTSLVLSAACGVGTLYFAFAVVERALARKTWFAVVAPVLLAASAGFACWTSGGLETQLFTVLVTCALDAVVAALTDPRALRRAGACLALAAMTRPEGPLVAALFGGAYLARKLVVYWLDRRRPVGLAVDATGEGRPDVVLRASGLPLLPPLRAEIVGAACFLALWAPWFAWRWWYYGWPFPNTYYVKAHGDWASPGLAHDMLENGLYYVWVWVKQTRLLWGAPLIVLACVASPRTPRGFLALVCAVFAVVYLAYAVTVGGDFMGLHRFIMPVFVAVAILVGLGLARLGELVPAPAGPWVAAAVAVIALAAFAWGQRALTIESLRFGNFANDRGIDTPAFLITYTEDRAKIGEAMAPCFTGDDFSIVGGAGAQPYYGRMRGIDVFGLVSERIAHDEPRVRARAGHTKFGGDKLLAETDPTFVFSCYQIHRTPAQPALPCAGFWLARGYEEITMKIPGMREQGEYYTFLAKRDRHFACPGVTR